MRINSTAVLFEELGFADRRQGYGWAVDGGRSGSRWADCDCDGWCGWTQRRSSGLGRDVSITAQLSSCWVLTCVGHGLVMVEGTIVRHEQALEIREAGYCETYVGTAT